MIEAKELAILFHETYERLAPQFGYKTRKNTQKFDEDSPNGRLMIAVCDKILKEITDIQKQTSGWTLDPYYKLKGKEIKDERQA